METFKCDIEQFFQQSAHFTKSRVSGIEELIAKTADEGIILSFSVNATANTLTVCVKKIIGWKTLFTLCFEKIFRVVVVDGKLQLTGKTTGGLQVKLQVDEQRFVTVL